MFALHSTTQYHTMLYCLYKITAHFKVLQYKMYPIYNLHCTILSPHLSCLAYIFIEECEGCVGTLLEAFRKALGTYGEL